ncbi:MAG: glycosyltransferase family 4 protein [Deltaproteobacteria bacterium]|nr:glycosyltransferase family 4 protein [Deltaproteobacteria bacterium]
MKILHVAAHLGDGAGKAVGGMARLCQAMGHQNAVLLLQEPIKRNHVDQCMADGVTFVPTNAVEDAVSSADIVVLNWWGSPVLDAFMEKFPPVPCRALLWAHKNGFYDPPLPESLVATCDGLLATSPLTATKWRDAALVYGVGDFEPEQVAPKIDYALHADAFVIGYVGSPGYKKLPPDALSYFRAVFDAVPNARFVMAGESDARFQDDLHRSEFADRVKLIGWTADVSSLLHGVDVFGYPLRRDTFATTENAILEAMAAALPVVMTRDPLGKFIVGENAGLLIESPEEFGAAMRALSRSEALRRLKGRSGRERVLSLYRGDSNARRFLEVCAAALRKDRTIHQFGG